MMCTLGKTKFCPACRLGRKLVPPMLRVFAGNLLVWADQTLNLLLLGNPRETVSERAARAREAGSAPAARFCAALTWIATRLGYPGDHCTLGTAFAVPPFGTDRFAMALDAEGGSSGETRVSPMAGEVWPWSG